MKVWGSDLQHFLSEWASWQPRNIKSAAANSFLLLQLGRCISTIKHYSGHCCLCSVGYWYDRSLLDNKADRCSQRTLWRTRSETNQGSSVTSKRHLPVVSALRRTEKHQGHPTKNIKHASPWLSWWLIYTFKWKGKNSWLWSEGRHQKKCLGILCLPALAAFVLSPF